MEPGYSSHHDEDFQSCGINISNDYKSKWYIKKQLKQFINTIPICNIKLQSARIFFCRPDKVKVSFSNDSRDYPLIYPNIHHSMLGPFAWWLKTLILGRAESVPTFFPPYHPVNTACMPISGILTHTITKFQISFARNCSLKKSFLFHHLNSNPVSSITNNIC